jgi:hypothetical protein
MIDSKEKGKRFERWACKWWHCVTGRAVERTAAVAPQLDNAGVDLIGTGIWAVQCKSVERSMDVHQIIDRMPLNAGINIVMHKRSKRGTVVSLRLDDFAWILSKLENEDLPSPSAN